MEASDKAKQLFNQKRGGGGGGGGAHNFHQKTPEMPDKQKSKN
jgi:hypothetical protein